jgi:hypothetical protein
MAGTGQVLLLKAESGDLRSHAWTETELMAVGTEGRSDAEPVSGGDFVMKRGHWGDWNLLWGVEHLLSCDMVCVHDVYVGTIVCYPARVAPGQDDTTTTTTTTPAVAVDYAFVTMLDGSLVQGAGDRRVAFAEVTMRVGVSCPPWLGDTLSAAQVGAVKQAVLAAAPTLFPSLVLRDVGSLVENLSSSFVRRPEAVCLTYIWTRDEDHLQLDEDCVTEDTKVALCGSSLLRTAPVLCGMNRCGLGSAKFGEL